MTKQINLTYLKINTTSLVLKRDGKVIGTARFTLSRDDERWEATFMVNATKSVTVVEYSLPVLLQAVREHVEREAGLPPAAEMTTRKEAPAEKSAKEPITSDRLLKAAGLKREKGASA